MRNRLSAEEWAELVREWEKSAQSARMFADAHGVAEASLRWWKTEFSRRSKKPAAPPSTSPSATRRTSRGPRAVKLARVVRDGEPVPDEEASTRTAGICIVVGYARIVVERGFDAALLRALIHAVGMPT